MSGGHCDDPSPPSHGVRAADWRIGSYACRMQVTKALTWLLLAVGSAVLGLGATVMWQLEQTTAGSTERVLLGGGGLLLGSALVAATVAASVVRRRATRRQLADGAANQVLSRRLTAERARADELLRQAPVPMV